MEEFPGDEKYRWFGACAGADYVHSERWAYSLLFNYADANDFEDSGTIFEGIDIKTVTRGASYYFMRNLKGMLELNIDLLEEDDDIDLVDHETKESYILLGFDAAF